MPGHIKKTSGPDPDPSHWLFVSYELKEKNKVIKLFLSHIIIDIEYTWITSLIVQFVHPVGGEGIG